MTLAGRAQGIEGGDPARIRPGLAGERGKGPDWLVVLATLFPERCRAHQLQGAGHGIAERLRREPHPASRTSQQPTASVDLRFEIAASLSGRFELFGRDALPLPADIARFDLPREAFRVPVTNAATKAAFDVVVEHLGETAELVLDGLGLPDQHFQNVVFGALRKHEVVAAYLRRRLKLAVDAPVALLDAARIPGQVEVEEIGAMRLEVQSLAGRVGGDEDAKGVARRVGIEAALDLFPPCPDGLPVDGLDALFGEVAARDGLFEHLAQVALGTDHVLREDEHPALVPAWRGATVAATRWLTTTRQLRAQVLADPFDEVACLGVRVAAGGGGHLLHRSRRISSFRRRASAVASPPRQPRPRR